MLSGQRQRDWRDPGEWVPLVLGVWRFAIALSHYPFFGYLFPPMLDILIVQVGVWLWILGQGVAVWWFSRWLLRWIRRRTAALPKRDLAVDPIRLAGEITLLIAAWGLIARWMIRDLALARYPRISLVLYYSYEAPFLGVLAAFSLLALFWKPAREGFSAFRIRHPAIAVGIVALAAAAFCAIGSRYVMYGYDFAQDEWVETFQSKLFAAGRIFERLPDAWRPFAKALTPVFIAYLPKSNSWIMGNLPVFALLRAPFEAAHVGRLVNPVLAGISVVLVAAIGRKMWPEQASAGLLAAVFLASSTQFLVTAMTGYAMPANLFFNLLWLWLYLIDRTWSRLLFPWIGAVALGVHYPLAHALFVVPFLFRIAFFRRQTKWTAYTAAVYLVGIFGWWQWLGIFRHGAERGAGWFFEVPGAFSFLRQSMSLSLFASWQTPLVVLLTAVAFIRFRALDETGRDLALGLVLTLGFYLFVLFDQGHGWGSRYSHGALGNVALLAVFGFLEMKLRRPGSVNLFLAISLAVTAIIQIPGRWIEAEESIRPFALASAYVRSLPAKVVLIDPAIGWYSGDLIRNDPAPRHGPLVVNSGHLTGDGRAQLDALYGGKERTLAPGEIHRFGISILSPAK